MNESVKNLRIEHYPKKSGWIDRLISLANRKAVNLNYLKKKHSPFAYQNLISAQDHAAHAASHRNAFHPTHNPSSAIHTHALSNAILLFIFIALAFVIHAKLFLNPNPNVFFLVYGVSATILTLGMVYFAHLYYKDPVVEILRKGTNKGKAKPFISIVFAVFNEENIIRQCMDSILASTYRNREIIVVNDASTDATKRILAEYAKHPDVRVINLEKNVGKKKAIGEGLRVARGEIFVFTDSDSVIDANAIERIIEIFMADPLVGAVSGHCRALNGDTNLITRVQDSWYEGQFAIKKAFESAFGSVSCISGPLAVFRRAAIYNYIPAWINDSFLGEEFRFATDRTLTAYVLGSRHIGAGLKKKYVGSPFLSTDYAPQEWKSLYCKSAKVWTQVPDTFNRFVKQNVRWKKSFVRNLFLTGSFYWRKPLPVALKYYLSALFVFVGPFIVLRHLIYFPALGDWSAPIFYLSGILFIGFIYALAFKIENPKSHIWIYRPLMSVMSTLVISFLIFYSIITIKKSVWHRT